MVKMHINNSAFQAAKNHPLQIGKLYSVDHIYIRDDDQNRIHDIRTNEGRINNVTFIVLTEAVKYLNKWTNSTSYRAKILTSNGIIGWVSVAHFENFRLIEYKL
jgi:hypothetical protein